MSPARRLDHRRRYLLGVGVAVVCGAGLRLVCAVRCCVGYDEVFVMGVGLDEITTSVRMFLVDVPVRRSDGITPLWWWLQAIPLWITGDLSLAGLRVWPVLLGALTLLLTGVVAAQRLGRGPALIVVVLAAGSDVLMFVNARGEYAESLLLAAALPATLLVGEPRRARIKGLLWLVLLMTHLGKGLLLVGGLLAAECVGLVLGSRPRRVRRAAGLAASVLIALVPTVVWLSLVGRVAFASGPIVTDAGARTGVVEALAAITVGYAETKAHVVASPLDAAQLYLDGAVWPTTTILAVPMGAGLLAAAAWSLGGGRRGRRGRLVISLLPWIIGGAAVVIWRGMVGARFHLLYLPALWTVAAVGLWRWRRAKAAWLGAVGVVWVLHLAAAFSWCGWSERAWSVSGATAAGAGLGVILVALAVYYAVRGRRRWGLVTAVLGLLVVGAWLQNGVWRWAPAGRFEPMAQRRVKPEPTLLERIDRWRSGQGEYPPPYDKTLYVHLVNYFLEKAGPTDRDSARAVHYAELDVRRDETDPRAWFYLGCAYQKQGRPAAQVRAAYRRSYELRPEPIVAEALQRLGD